MANKARPKKVVAPYRKYVAGEGFSKVSFSRQSSSSVTASMRKMGFSETSSSFSSSPNGDVTNYNHNGEAMTLPWELQKLIIQFASYLPPTESSKSRKRQMSQVIPPAFCLVCHQWYQYALPILYHSPRLSYYNFHSFVDALAMVRKKKNGDMVYQLDLSTILQSGKNSYVSKLLRRCSKNLVKFTAPQTSFGYSPLISLKSCHNLKFLDLGLVSETVKLKELFVAIMNFKSLTHLSFPRSSIDCDGCENGFQWPANLLYLKLSGGLTNEFIRNTNWPMTIKTLEFSDCPQLDEQSIYVILDKVGNNLKHLLFYYPMPSLRDNSLDFIFRYCPNLLTIQLMVDYCTKWTFSEYMLTKMDNFERPLKTVILKSSGRLGMASKIHPDDFTIAILEDRLPCLQRLTISEKLGWDMKGDDVEDLINAIEDQDGSLYSVY
ncbi:F-box protein YDR306C [Monosporozyma servazzii]